MCIYESLVFLKEKPLIFGRLRIYRLNGLYNIVSPRRVGLVVSVSASHTVGRGFASRPGHTKGHHKNVTNLHCLTALHACVKVEIYRS